MRRRSVMWSRPNRLAYHWHSCIPDNQHYSLRCHIFSYAIQCWNSPYDDSFRRANTLDSPPHNLLIGIGNLVPEHRPAYSVASNLPEPFSSHVHEVQIHELVQKPSQLPYNLSRDLQQKKDVSDAAQKRQNMSKVKTLLTGEIFTQKNPRVWQCPAQ